VPPPDSRTKMKQVISTASEAGEEGEHENIGKIDKSVSEDGELGPLSLDPVTEEYREEQAFRRWVVAQVGYLGCPRKDASALVGSR